MKIKKSLIPNYITALRILGTVLLAFIKPLSIPFYIVYTICGISDVLDGIVARATKTATDFGARLDSIADLLFYAVMLIKIFPILLLRLPIEIWYIVAAVAIIRLCSYILAAVKYHRFAALHTYLNKFTGLLVFTVPYVLTFSISTVFCFVTSAVAGIASLEELIIHILSKKYNANIKTIIR